MTPSAAANAAALEDRKAGRTATFAAVRLVAVGTMSTPKYRSTSGTVLGLGVFVGVCVFEGVAVWLAVTLAVALQLAVVLGVGVGERLGVLDCD